MIQSSGRQVPGTRSFFALLTPYVFPERVELPTTATSTLRLYHWATGTCIQCNPWPLDGCAYMGPQWVSTPPLDRPRGGAGNRIRVLGSFRHAVLRPSRAYHPQVSWDLFVDHDAVFPVDISNVICAHSFGDHSLDELLDGFAIRMLELETLFVVVDLYDVAAATSVAAVVPVVHSDLGHGYSLWERRLRIKDSNLAYRVQSAAAYQLAESGISPAP
jgi:hypothetical protein